MEGNNQNQNTPRWQAIFANLAGLTNGLRPKQRSEQLGLLTVRATGVDFNAPDGGLNYAYQKTSYRVK